MISSKNYETYCDSNIDYDIQHDPLTTMKDTHLPYKSVKYKKCPML